MNMKLKLYCMFFVICPVLTGCGSNEGLHVQCTTLVKNQWGSTEADSFVSDPEIPIWIEYKLLVDGRDHLYILRKGENRVLSFDKSGILSYSAQDRDSSDEIFSDFGITPDGKLFVAVSSPVTVNLANVTQQAVAYTAIYEFNERGQFQKEVAEWKETEWLKDGIINGYSGQAPFLHIVVPSDSSVFSTWGVIGKITQYPQSGEPTVIYDGGIRFQDMIAGKDGLLYIITNEIPVNNVLILKYDPHSGEFLQEISLADFGTQENHPGLLRAVDAEGTLYFDGGNRTLRGPNTLLKFSANGELKDTLELPGYFADIDEKGSPYVFVPLDTTTSERFEVQKCSWPNN